MTGFVGALHEFHDAEFAQGRANRFIPTPERLQLFDTIIERLIDGPLFSQHIVELGIGPGYLATRLLEKMPNVSYQGIDFSPAMLDIAANRLESFSSRIEFTQADLVKEDWAAKVTRPVGAIVSTWALHDLGSPANVASVYQACRTLLPSGGILLNGDFVKPEGTLYEYEAGRFLLSRHLDMLRDAGFSDVKNLIFLEKELAQPTSTQNYACIEGIA